MCIFTLSVTGMPGGARGTAGLRLGQLCFSGCGEGRAPRVLLLCQGMPCVSGCLPGNATSAEECPICQQRLLGVKRCCCCTQEKMGGFAWECLPYPKQPS